MTTIEGSCSRLLGTANCITFDFLPESAKHLPLVNLAFAKIAARKNIIAICSAYIAIFPSICILWIHLLCCIGYAQAPLDVVSYQLPNSFDHRSLFISSLSYLFLTLAVSVQMFQIFGLNNSMLQLLVFLRKFKLQLSADKLDSNWSGLARRRKKSILSIPSSMRVLFEQHSITDALRCS